MPAGGLSSLVCPRRPRHASPGARPACSPDLPQGLPKKIQINLLLADLALLLGNARAGRLKFRGRPFRRRLRGLAARSRSGRFCLARPPATAQSLRTARQEAIAPNVQILAHKLQFAPQGAHILARQHPADHTELELSAEKKR